MRPERDGNRRRARHLRRRSSGNHDGLQRKHLPWDTSDELQAARLLANQAAVLALPVCMEAARWMALRMRWYVPQRQMLPLMASSMSVSVGLGFFESSATADMICPDWQ